MTEAVATILHAHPPNIDAIAARFGDAARGGTVVFAYAPHVYVPSGRPLAAPLEAHERLHLEQQGDDPAGWWDRYLSDDDFRLSQELAAFRLEWKVARKLYRDRERAQQIRRGLARRLSSPLYGRLVTYQKALRLIR